MFAMFARECGIWFSCLNVAVRTANIANIGFLTGNAHIGQIEKELSLVEGARDSGEVPERCAPPDFNEPTSRKEHEHEKDNDNGRRMHPLRTDAQVRRRDRRGGASG